MPPGFDPTEDLLSCNCFQPCGLDCRSSRETTFHLEDVTRTNGLTLGEPRPGNPREVLVAVQFESDKLLLGPNSRSTSAEPAGLSPSSGGNTSFDYFSGHANGGTIRAGGVVDFSLAQPLLSGRHRLGDLVLHSGSAASLDDLRLHEVLFVLHEGTSAVSPRWSKRASSTPDRAPCAW